MPRSRNPRFGQRRIKMLRPICSNGCEGLTADWYATCPHDPYIGVGEKRVTTPVYSEPREDGSVIVEKMEERVTFEIRPNWAEVTVSMKVNAGQGVERARRKGFILPTELNSPAYPNGIARLCEFRGCYWQHDLLDTRFGVFCKEIEAKRVAQDRQTATARCSTEPPRSTTWLKAGKQLDEIAI